MHRRGLNLYARVRYHTQRDLLMRVCFDSLSLRVSFLFTLLACCQLVAHPVGKVTVLVIFACHELSILEFQVSAAEVIPRSPWSMVPQLLARVLREGSASTSFEIGQNARSLDVIEYVPMVIEQRQ
jgi:hypothetical protein